MKKSVLFVLFICTAAVLTAQKTKAEAAQELLDQLVKSKEFRIESQWAIAQGGSGVNAIAKANLQPPGSSGNRFNLIGIYNFLEMKGDTVVAVLPYYGERQMGGSHYEQRGGIEFEGAYSDLVIEHNEKKKSYEISFDVSEKTETFQVNIELFQNLKSRISVNSNQRFVIRYDGKVSELPAEEGSEGERKVKSRRP